MAKRSDFAQKLLDDLRLRKERMGASQSSKGSKPMAGDAYTYYKPANRGGSREIIKTNQTAGGSTQNRSSRSNRSLSVGEASKELVPFGRGQSSEKMGDLSMALAYTLENAGKLSRMDSSGNSSIMGFLHQIGRRSVDWGKMETGAVDRHHPSTSQFPTLSHFHINEISKGAQRLNQILRACSNGLNFDGFSIEIGKELLKGAMDLEESLRMLVNLQEASEYMIAPKSKTRITLLDDEDDDNNTDNGKVEVKELGRPRFSFDKPSRNSHYIQEVARTDLQQRLVALTYPSEARNFNYDMHSLSTSNSVTHKRSSSCGSSAKAVSAEQKNQSSMSTTKSEKGRIPNVIAKLMGLEELPENEDSKHVAQKESGSKKKIGGTVINRTAGGSTKKEQNIKDAEILVPSARKHKQILSQQIPATYALQEEKNPATVRASYEEVIHDRRQPRKEVEEIKPMSSSSKASITILKQQSHTAQPNQSSGTRKNSQEREKSQDNTKPREQKGKAEAKVLILKNELQQIASLETQKGSEPAISLQLQTECSVSMLLARNTEARTKLFNNQPKSLDDHRFQQPYTLHDLESQRVKHQAGNTQKPSGKQKIRTKKQIGNEGMSRSLPKAMNREVSMHKTHPHPNQAMNQNGSPTEPSDVMQPKGFSNHSYHEDFLQHRTQSNITMEDTLNGKSNQNSSPTDLRLELAQGKTSTKTAMVGKPVHPLSMQKAKVAKAQKVERPRKFDELMTRKGVAQHNLARPSKHHTSILPEVKQIRRDKLGGSKESEQQRATRSKQAEAYIIKSNQSVASIQQPKVMEEPKFKTEEDPMNGECQGPQIQAPNKISQNIVSTVTNDQQIQEPDFERDEQRPININMEPLKVEIFAETHEDSSHIMYPSGLENQGVSKVETPEPLTETETHLKQIVMKSRLFLNTAEALFKLNIPFAVLDAGGIDYHTEESKLILDCGYEVMKRKGKKQELSIHPFMKLSITATKVTTLDKLIKQLNKDFEKLKRYGCRNDNAGEPMVEDYMPKMLENDVYDRNPDLNCMWDLGWNDMVFASGEKDDVIRDVERFLLNGLLGEVTMDLLLLLQPVF